MYLPANPHSFEMRSNPFQGGLAAGGASPFLHQPWPPLGPGILEANLMLLAAAAPGGWLAGVVPAMLNAAMTPAFRGFPPVMLAALPLSQANMDSHGAIMFASALNEFGITDLIVAEGHVPGPLLARLREPGGSQSWQMPGPDGEPMTATFYRVDVPTDDGSWLIQADVSCGGRTVSSQLVRANQVIADPHRPQAFRDGVARGHASWMRHAAEGQDARMALVCDDGAGRSGAAAVLLRQMSHQQAHEFSGHPGATVPSDELRWADNEFIGEGVRRRGSAFAGNQELFLNPTAGRPTTGPRDGSDDRAGARSYPPEALFQPPFVWRPRRMQPDAGCDSDGSSSSGSRGSSTSGYYSISDVSLPSDVDWTKDEVFESGSVDKPSFVVEDAPESPALPASPPVIAQEARAPVRQRDPEPALLDKPIPTDTALPQPLTPTQAITLAQANRMLARLPAVATHDPEADDRAARLKDRRIIAAVARAPDSPTALPRSGSAPDLLRSAREAEAATSRALAQARAASEPTLGTTSGERPLRKAMGTLFREIETSQGLVQTLKRAVTFGKGAGPWPDEVTDRMTLVVDQLRRVHAKQHPTRNGVRTEAGKDADFIFQSLVKAAGHAFNDLQPDTRLRLIRAFHGDGGQLAALRDKRDDLLTTMTRLARSSDPVSGDPGSLSPAFRTAEREHEALNYTITALESAVPSKQVPASRPAAPPAA